MKQGKRTTIVVTAPLSGKVISITEVPDPVFSGKMMGDGAAILPEDGKIYAPIDGVLTTIAPTQHAFGYTGENGQEVLVHVGLETVGLNGEGFTVHKKAGDKVKAGDLVAEVDLEFLKNKGLNTVTPVVICGGADGAAVEVVGTEVTGGKSPVLELQFEEAAPEEAAKEVTVKEEPKAAEDKKAEKKAKKEKKKFKINFEFLQKFGKVLMVVIAVMPAAGLMISLGKLVGMCANDIAVITTIGSVMENIGWAIINNLNLLFAIAIGGSWAKERAGGAFAACIAFILINNITGQIFGVTDAMLADPNAFTHTLFGQTMAVDGYFVSVLGAPALNMGVFIGMISGFTGAIIYNKYYNLNSPLYTQVASEFGLKGRITL